MPRWNVHFDMHVRTGDPELVGLVAKARALASVIHGIPIPPHLQERLDRLNIVRAVRGTTGIEGVELSEEEVGEVLDAPAGTRVLAGSREREEQEVKNAAALMHAVAETLENAQGAPLSEALVQAIHSIVTHNIDYLYNVPGRYRTHRVVAGSYVPPEDGEEVARLMAEFMRWFATGAPAAWGPDSSCGRRPLLRHQHPPVRRWEWPYLPRRGELPVVPGRDQCTRLLFPGQFLLSESATVLRGAGQGQVPNGSRPHTLRPLCAPRVG